MLKSGKFSRSQDMALAMDKENNMIAGKLAGGWKTKMIAVLVTVFFVFAVVSDASAAFPVSVVNWPMLMSLIQQQVTQMIVNMITNVWREEVMIKLMRGLLNIVDIQKFVQMDFTGFTDALTSTFGTQLGSFASNHISGLRSWESVVQSTIQIPLLRDALGDGQQYMNQMRSVSRLLAGAPANYDRSKMSLPQLADAQLNDIMKRFSIESFEQSGEAVVIAENYKKEIQSFKPSDLDSAYPEQAIKDMAKMLYLNGMLQAEILKTLGKAEQRNATVFR